MDRRQRTSVPGRGPPPGREGPQPGLRSDLHRRSDAPHRRRSGAGRAAAPGTQERARSGGRAADHPERPPGSSGPAQDGAASGGPSRPERTRLVTLQWSQGNGDVIYRWAGSTRQHHALTHQGSILPEQDKINRWYYEQLAYLLGKMNEVKEGDGTLLDNSVVVFANELHSGFAHRTDPSPVILAGGGGGYFKTGRYLKFPEIVAGGPGPSSSPNQSQLLASLCQYMGAAVTAVGDMSLGPAGPLPGLR